MATDLVINIASQFLGKKSFNEAEAATKKLTHSVKSLGAALGVSLSVGAVLAFGKASVMAAANDAKAQKILANSLKNVGLAYAQIDVENFITKMQAQTGILKEQLRPAFANLAGVTGSVAKTEKIMGLAFDVSSGSGLDYASTVDILSQAYVGNRKGLKQLNMGLTASEQKAMSFDEIMAALTARFGGSGATAMATFTGQIDLLKVSASIATETIGKSLLGAIDSLSGSTGMSGLGTDIENAAKSLSNFIDSVVYLKEQLGSIPGAGLVKGAFGLIGNILGRFSPQRAAELLKDIKGAQPFSQPMSISSQSTGMADVLAKKKAELDAIKRNKELAALAKAQAAAAIAAAKAKKDQAALDKAALALGKGQDVFNLDAIQLNAAMVNSAEALSKATTQGQLLAITNDLARLQVKKDMLTLEDAIAAKDVGAATAAAAKLNTDLGILGTLNNQALKLSDIKRIVESILPKSLIDLANLDAAIAKIKEMNALQGLKVSTTGAVTPITTSPTTTTTATGTGWGTNKPLTGITQADTSLALASGSSGLDALMEMWAAAAAAADAASMALDAQTAAANAAFMSGSLGKIQGVGGNTTVTIVDNTSGLIKVVQSAVQENARYGNNLTYAGAI